MKFPYILAVFVLLLNSIFLVYISFDQNDLDSKISFDYELKLKCATDFWDQFAKDHINQATLPDNSDLKTSLVCLSKKSDKYDLVLTYANYKGELGESLRMGEGDFKMIGKSGDYIFGTYEGMADQEGNHQDLLLFFNVEGGTGTFEGAYGQFSTKCQPDEINPKVKVLSLKGTIRLDDKNKLKLLAFVMP